MQFGERRLNGVTVVDVAGTLTSENPGRLREKVAQLVRRGEKHLVLNLHGLTYVDSAGLGELVSCYTRVTRVEGKIALANAQQRVQDLLEMTNLLTIFESFDSEAAATASFPRLAA